MHDKRTCEIGEVSCALKALAVQTGAAFLTLAQLNVESEKDKGCVPRLSDLSRLGPDRARRRYHGSASSKQGRTGRRQGNARYQQTARWRAGWHSARIPRPILPLREPIGPADKRNPNMKGDLVLGQLGLPLGIRTWSRDPKYGSSLHLSGCQIL